VIITLIESIKSDDPAVPALNFRPWALRAVVAIRTIHIINNDFLKSHSPSINLGCFQNVMQSKYVLYERICQ